MTKALAQRWFDLSNRLLALSSSMSMKDNETVTDILSKAVRYGDVTDNQARFLNSIFDRAEKPAAVEAKAVDLFRINQMFDTAAELLKKPFVNFSLDGTSFFRLSPAPATGRNPGCLYIKAGDEYAGKIDAEGRFSAARNAPEGIQAALEAFAADPQAAALAYGRATGNCCFCAKALEDEVSVQVGYGPICAKRWGLPHRHTGLRAA